MEKNSQLYLSMDEIKKNFSSRLKQMRLLAGLTQKELADLLSVKRAYISMMEKGELPSTEIFCQLVQIFRCSADYLLGFDRRRYALYETELPLIDGYRIGKPKEAQNIVGSVIVHKAYKADFAIIIKHNWYAEYGIYKGDAVLIKLSETITDLTNIVFARTTHCVEPRLFFIEKNEQGETVLVRPRGRIEEAEPEVVPINSSGVNIVGFPVGIIRMFTGKRMKGKKKEEESDG